MPLPTCQCNAGLPTQQQLGNIYCALLDVIAGQVDIDFPLLPSLGGTGVANADTETLTLNGGFPLAFTLTGDTDVTLPTSGTFAVTGITGFNSVTTEGAAIASAATVNLDAATGYFLHITGVVTITALTLAQGNMRVLIFDGVLTLTNGAGLLLPTSANISTAAGDMALVIGEGAAVTRVVSYQRKDGTALVGSNPFDQSLNTTDTPTFTALNVGGDVSASGFNGTINGLSIQNNAGNTLDITGGKTLSVVEDYTLTAGGSATTIDAQFSSAPGTGAIGVPTLVFGDPVAGLLGGPSGWIRMVVNGADVRVPIYAA